MSDVIETVHAPAAIGPYSQGILSGSLVFCSGQLPVDSVSGVMPDDVADQARQSLSNVRAVLTAAGYSMENVAKVTIFLTDMVDFTAVNGVYGEFFQKPYPARSCVAVAALPKAAKIEIEVIAYKA